MSNSYTPSVMPNWRDAAGAASVTAKDADDGRKQEQRAAIGKYIGDQIERMTNALAEGENLTYEEMRISILHDLAEGSKMEVLRNVGNWERIIGGTMKSDSPYTDALERLLDEYPSIILDRDARKGYEKICTGGTFKDFGAG